jgi:hypothetical protein
MRTRDTRVCRVYTHATRRLIAFLRRGVVLPAIHCRVLTFGTTRAWRGLEYSTPLHFDFRYNTKVLPSYTPCFVHVLYLLSYGANVLLDYLSRRPKVRRARVGSTTHLTACASQVCSRRVQCGSRHARQALRSRWLRTLNIQHSTHTPLGISSHASCRRPAIARLPHLATRCLAARALKWRAKLPG